MINFPFPKLGHAISQRPCQEYFSRNGAKARRKALETRQRFAPLRRRGRNIPGSQA